MKKTFEELGDKTSLGLLANLEQLLCKKIPVPVPNKEEDLESVLNCTDYIDDPYFMAAANKLTNYRKHVSYKRLDWEDEETCELHGILHELRLFINRIRLFPNVSYVANDMDNLIRGFLLNKGIKT